MCPDESLIISQYFILIQSTLFFKQEKPQAFQFQTSPPKDYKLKLNYDVAKTMALLLSVRNCVCVMFRFLSFFLYFFPCVHKGQIVKNCNT